MVCEALRGEEWESEKTYIGNLALSICMILDEPCNRFELRLTEWMSLTALVLHCKAVMR